MVDHQTLRMVETPARETPLRCRIHQRSSLPRTVIPAAPCRVPRARKYSGPSSRTTDPLYFSFFPDFLPRQHHQKPCAGLPSGCPRCFLDSWHYLARIGGPQQWHVVRRLNRRFSLLARHPWLCCRDHSLAIRAPADVAIESHCARHSRGYRRSLRRDTLPSHRRTQISLGRTESSSSQLLATLLRCLAKSSF